MADHVLVRAKVMEDILAERERQLALGWSINHDDTHTTAEFAGLITERVNPMLFGHTPVEKLREEMVEVAALAVAAIERIDR